MKEVLASLANPLKVGEQRKLNHEKCPAGEDVKERLYVKEVSTGTLFYCHHCQSKGFLRTPDVKRVSELLERKLEHKATETCLLGVPTSVAFRTGWKEFPTTHQLWLLSYELDEHDTIKYGIYSDSTLERLYLSGHVVHNATVGIMQSRNFLSSEPKYLTFKLKDGEFVVGYKHTDKECTNMFVVEDLLSAYKIHKAGGDVVCLMGTKANETETLFLARCPHVTIWMDNDSAGVCAAAKLQGQLSAYTTVATMMSLQQPKETPLTRLKEIVNVK